MKGSKKYIVFALVVCGVIAVLLSVGFRFLSKSSKTTLVLESLAVVEKAMQLLPVENDTKQTVEAANTLAQEVLKVDDVTRVYLVMLQNNMELRPGGGFLGQYAIVKIKNGQIENLFIEDANILNKRVEVKVPAPYPFRRMIQMKRWKFSDSNFSPDFPTNVEKAEYFLRLSGNGQKFDGVFAINADVLNAALAITGPIQPTGYSTTFSSEDGALKLEEVVEKAYLGDEVPAHVKEQRKNILKVLGKDIAHKLFSLNNVPKLVDFAQDQLEKKNIMLFFQDPSLRQTVEKVHWDGSVSADWSGDYLMLSDANLGALKSDYYIRRSMKYDVDLTAEKPTAVVTYVRNHTATKGNWRTSDYHSYLRVYAPQGSKLLGQENAGAPITRDEFNKTFFGFITHTRIGEETRSIIRYELPERFKNQKDYSLLLQKQSGVNDMPVEISVKTSEGMFHQQNTLVKDLKYGFGKPQ